MPTSLDAALSFVAALALCTLRWVPIIALVPVFANHALTAICRAVVTIVFALPAAPHVVAGLDHTPPPLAQWLGLAAKEAGIGLVLAGLIAAPFWAVQAAGIYLDYQRGGNPQALDPAASVDASALGVMLQQALVVYVIHTGGLHALLDTVWTSYTVYPPLDGFFPFGGRAQPSIGVLLASTMRFGLLLAFPYLVALALVEACFAVVSRVNAKFPAYVAALPFKSVALLLLIALTLPRLLDTASDIAAQRAGEIRDLMRAATPKSERAVPDERSSAAIRKAVNDER